ncbi:hypothetical protein [Porphyrobacter sp. YT40]|uniref:hypothetical protein n=1 Tax=Porphyrobacter sp. YT40 TaxID=2547601 RepID=UPI0011415C20|nr:hypothetical protein [Porphyrobacter sp. YT40]QDH35915.1 hypothetical protein E2E27_17255 [Porphyrobacter sp. YT40]
MNYVTVFDASDVALKGIGFIIPGLVVSLVGAILVFRPKFVAAIGFVRRAQSPIFNWLVFLFAIAWTVIVGGVTISRSLAASEALKEGNCETVEGRVENFHPMPREGHDTERFEVAGKSFSYSDYIMSSGFNNSASHGGPIREDLQVRICHQSGVILRLEIAR